MSCNGLEDMLNDDILQTILALLTVHDRINCEQICKRWLRVSLVAWSTVRSLNVAQLLAGQSELLHKRILLSFLVRTGPYLQNVTFANSNMLLSKAELAELIRLCPNLRCLCLSGAQLEEDAILALYNSSNQLRQLQLHSSFSFPGKNKSPELGTLEEAHMTLAFASLPQLLSLDLSRCDITGICLMSLSSTLSSISLGGTGRMTLDLRLLQRFLQNHPNLTEFHINYTKGSFTHDLPQLLSQWCPLLTILELSDLENCNFAGVSGLRNLQQLSINQRWTHLSADQQQLLCLDDSALIQICRSCTRLESLSIRGYDLHRKLSAASLSAIGGLTQLKTLILTDAPVIDDRILLQICQRLSLLNQLNLSNCSGLTDNSVALIGCRCPALCLIKFNGCANVSTDGINSLITSLVGGGYFTKLEIFASDTKVEANRLVIIPNVTVETSQ